MTSKRKMLSYERAELLARELRYQLWASPTKQHIDLNILFKRLNYWMAVTGKIKYKRP